MHFYYYPQGGKDGGAIKQVFRKAISVFLRVGQRILFQVRCPLGNVIFNLSGSCQTLQLSKVLILSSKPSTALLIWMINFHLILVLSLATSSSSGLNCSGTDYRHPERVFSKISNFWAWADKLDQNILGHLGYFRPNY